MFATREITVPQCKITIHGLKNMWQNDQSRLEDWRINLSKYSIPQRKRKTFKNSWRRIRTFWLNSFHTAITSCQNSGLVDNMFPIS